MSLIKKESLIKEIVLKNIFIVSLSPDKSKWVPLKNGIRTPLFLDTSKFNSFPRLAEKINRFAVQLIKEKKLAFDKIMGLPYGGLLFSYGIANILKFPCLSIRKEGKKIIAPPVIF